MHLELSPQLHRGKSCKLECLDVLVISGTKLVMANCSITAN
jgi:hypothetical protein